jgi:hypothetical protein
MNRNTDRHYTVLQQRLEDAWFKYERNKELLENKENCELLKHTT